MIAVMKNDLLMAMKSNSKVSFSLEDMRQGRSQRIDTIGR